MEHQQVTKTDQSDHQVQIQSSSPPAQSDRAPVHRIRRFQRLAGNQAVQRLIQAKLTVSQPGDQYEQEADRVADTVMRMPEPFFLAPSGLVPGHIQSMQIQRANTKCREENAGKIHPKEPSGQTPTVTHALEARLTARGGSGQPLPEVTRTFMESRFGHDFSQVRLHTDAEAAQMNREVKAQAFTRQQDIYFGTGKYNLESSKGQRLLAHELTHVILKC